MSLGKRSARGSGRAIALALAHPGFCVAICLPDATTARNLPAESVYCMTTAAISHLTKCLAIAWGRYNVTVNAVAPTFISTPGTDAALAAPAFRADVLERIAGLHRIGAPVDVVGAVVFLASPAASLITGHTILIDGGWTAR